MRLTIKNFIKQAKTLETKHDYIKVKIFDKVLTGPVKDVYEQLRELSTKVRFSESTELIVEPLNRQLLVQVLAWLEEVSGLIEACRSVYAVDLDEEDKIPTFRESRQKNIEFLSKVEDLYSNLFRELEETTVKIDNYLDGLEESPNLDKLEVDIKRLRLLTHSDLIENKFLKYDWFDAVYLGLADIIDLFIWYGQDYNIYDDKGRQAIHVAAKRGNTQIIELLLQAGADPDKLDRAEKSPLYWAIRENSTKTVKLLLDNGANPNEQDFMDNNPFGLACFMGSLEIVKLLIDNGADVNIKDTTGTEPIHIASMYNRINIVKLLIANGADVNAEDIDGMSTLTYAANAENVDMVKFLLEAGVRKDVNTLIEHLRGIMPLSPIDNEILALLTKYQVGI